ncbi:hypothetical protein FB192DRAFT_1363330, partial [Mucor lusitanicus]
QFVTIYCLCLVCAWFVFGLYTLPSLVAMDYYIRSTFYYFLSRDIVHSLVCSIAIYSLPLFCTRLFFCCCTTVL